MVVIGDRITFCQVERALALVSRFEPHRTAKHLIGFAFLLVGLAAVLPAAAQDPSTAVQSQNSANSVFESFDGDEITTVLGGQFRASSGTSPWLVYLSDGRLVLENRQDADSLHYNDIAFVRYPNSTIVETTENATISAIVEGSATSTGGVGILVGSGKAGVYLAFTVDSSGRYHLFQKDGRQLRTVTTDTSAAILSNRPNELSYEVRGANIAFLINGEDTIQIESPNLTPASRRIDGRTGVGVAAFGVGTFYFDSVTISKAN